MEAVTVLGNPMLEPKQAESLQLAEIQELVTEAGFEDGIAYDDNDCLICYQTIYRPAKTECGHSACESCMLHWAMTAMDTKTDSSGGPELPSNSALTVEGIKFKCPTCRTYTEARFDATRNELLTKLYPSEYAIRASESEGLSHANEDGSESMVFIFGNSHRKVPPTISPYSGKMREHEWTFFLKCSNQSIVEKVEVILHPSFREDRLVTLTQAPFASTHLGWGFFTIFAGVVLKEGWEWVDEVTAVDSDSDKGRVRDRLPLQWLLDFRDGGSMTNKMVKVKKITETKVGDVDDGDGETDHNVDGKMIDSDDDDDFGALASFMSESEIAQLKEVRRMKKQALRDRKALNRSRELND